MRTAVLSNINVNPVIRLLKNKKICIFETEGYGNELGYLLNPESSLNIFNPEAIFLIIDLMELISHELDIKKAKDIIENWFSTLESTISIKKTYYISDAYLFSAELNVLIDKCLKSKFEYLWQEQLEVFINKFTNVYVFPLKNLIETIGSNNSFSQKMWYMGKILYSPIMNQELSEEIINFIKLQSFVPKKVLVLDLDNTLWGGLAGENDLTPIVLSDDKLGLAYKNLQRVIQQMRRQGVILAIVSKNNKNDVLEIIGNHPHMVLNISDFAIMKINWESKDKNICDIALNLNIGLDSIVFFDDNPSERALIEQTLPEVTVADFPISPELLPNQMVKIWKDYFIRASITDEDLKKTEQYLANSKREEQKKLSANFVDYLKTLKMQLISCNPLENVERITQLINKTNQFNLTTKRHSKNEIEKMLQKENLFFFAYKVVDKFGDNGIVAVVVCEIVSGTPVIKEFVMSCRVMGKKIENAIIDNIEKFFFENGYKYLEAELIKTKRNIPVVNFYEGLDYAVIEEKEGYKKYHVKLSERTKRDYILDVKEGNQ